MWSLNMVKQKTNIVVAIRDYNIDGVFEGFIGDKPFEVELDSINTKTTEYVGGFFYKDDGVVTDMKPTSKMNVSFRGDKGRFVSYKALPKKYNFIKTVVENLPNI
ncbi:hypothetical protein LAh8_138 [Aeromonas phage LAh_8]|uniref:Uncharacterized protein n=2 Tax=Lahexavirus TaxID=2843411 RepID=A0A514A0J9_9CAUD|nr:hypothetical protein HWC31_gp139 [Aeromonas phage LAh_8]QDH46807.1 hypothetical protein LAh8_138 [Aeromonas phage LAh_8]